MKRKREDTGKEKEEHEPKRRKKTDYPNFFPKRMRAHSNPLNDAIFSYPITPRENNWEEFYPGIGDGKITIVDVGCAFAGLICSLAPEYPKTNMLGMEIREGAVSYSQQRIQKLRKENEGQYNNIWVIQNNVMKYLPNFIQKHQLDKIFFCFPDPHFKKKNYRKRIISVTLLDEYAYVLKPDALLYTITDVKDLHDWMKGCLEKHPLFQPMEQQVWEKDPLIPFIKNSSEDAIRTTTKKLNKYICVYKRIEM